ncbi:uncharacterized protein LOC111630127 [Centruroides sculpturatus]|uniref:uncharacterized protein LOC111630127 n=1 Tax=Centruroides sculpturatus TaxID=218467 RepID=UPI000C6EF118|nr:uncharacterized protein LOC111630127 [Centruroides sculpturatus]
MACNQNKSNTLKNTNRQSTKKETNINYSHDTINIRILQLNAQKSKAASSLLIKTANDTNSDIIMIQEPYTIDNTIVRFGNWRVLAGHCNTRPKSGILVCNTSLDIALIPQLCSYRICTAVIHQKRPIYIIGVYFSPDDEHEDCINELANIIRRIDTNSVIIARDLNAKSAIWLHNKKDKRRRLVADLMEVHDLMSTNMTTYPTFHTPHAEGWTDICLVSMDLSHRIVDCETMLIPSASDHRYIMTQISNITISNPKAITRANTLTGNSSGSFSANNGGIMIFSRINTQKDIDDYVNFFTKAMQSAKEQATRTKTKRQRKTPWWTEELTIKKKKTTKIRRNITRTNNEDEKTRLKQTYKI